MNLPVIQVEGLSKRYRLGGGMYGYRTIRESIAGTAAAASRRLFGKITPRNANGNDFWALRDVGFTVRPGEVVGIVGRNGAGKSTLLKILSRITEPTSGEAILRGRCAGLLEVGTGFHPELTGRENIFLNGGILGMTTREIRRKFDQIVEFAEIAAFLDTPVKRYSSGMYVRLAFAVSAHLDPDILFVDEVLAVGDVAFQQKCLRRMRDVAAQARTILFVSHSMQAVSSLCSRAILLEAGRIVADGDVEQVVSSYLRQEQASFVSSWQGDCGDDSFRLTNVAVGAPDNGCVSTSTDLVLRLNAHVIQPITGLVCAVEVYSARNQILAYSAVDDDQPPPAPTIPPGDYSWELTIPADTLAAGKYEFRIDIGIHNLKKIVTKPISIWVDLSNIHGLGRRFQSGWVNCFRPNWKWRRLP